MIDTPALTAVNVDAPWRSEAACRTADPALFLDKGDEQGALDVCDTCPVAGDCLLSALANRDDEGVFGATLPAERTRLVKAVKAGDEDTLLRAGLGRGDLRIITAAWDRRADFQNWQKSYLQTEQAIDAAALA